MTVTNSLGRQNEKNSWMRVLGVDPAATGPTGYGIVESNGRHCHMLHYGTLKVAAKRQRESAGAALAGVYTLACRGSGKVFRHATAVAMVFNHLAMFTDG